ncbi:reverse transcriptase domain-containing protein [Tanacetum coccineum]
MVTPAEKRDPNKYCEFHADTGHSTDECMQLRKQIDEMIKSGKLSQFIKELKQSDKPKAQKKGETAEKDKPLAILMIQPWERVAKQRVTQSFSPETTISFSSLGAKDGTEGPMIIEAEIGGHFVHRIYVDGGASSEVLYEHCFVRLRPEVRSQMVPATTSLIGFSGETIWPTGQIFLLVKIGDEDHSTSAWMNFMVIRSPSQHNGIIGSTGIRKIRAVPSTTHGMLKFPVKGGTVTIRSSRAIPMECAMISGPSTQHPVTSQVLEEKIKVVIHPEYPEQTIAIGSTLTEKKTQRTMCFAQAKPGYFCLETSRYDGCPCGYPFKCFLDAYKGYHQIKMAEEDEEKTAFITSQGIFCYTKMPFGLKNAGATYQRLVDRAFQKQIGRNLKVYVDDLVIKSHTEEEIIRDIAETFKTLRQINMITYSICLLTLTSESNRGVRPHGKANGLFDCAGNHHFSCSSTRFNAQIIRELDPTYNLSPILTPTPILY